MQPLIRPRPIAYALPLLLVLVGALAGHQFYGRRLEVVAAGLRQVPAPGTTRLSLPRAGHHSIFLEHRSLFEGVAYLTGRNASDLRCRVASAGGREVTLHRAWFRPAYDLGTRAGVLVFDLWIPFPGDYDLVAEHPGGVVGPRVVLAVGEGLLGDLPGEVVAGLAASVGPFLAGIVAAFVIWLRRERAKRNVYGRFRR